MRDLDLAGCPLAALVLVLERINTPEPRCYLILVFLAFFVVLSFLIVSAKIFSLTINEDGCFLSILTHDRFVALLAFASFFFDPKNLIVAGLFLHRGLGGLGHILHFDLRFLVRRLCQCTKGEAGADNSRCNQVPCFHMLYV